jgi:hypothetical protein
MNANPLCTVHLDGPDPARRDMESAALLPNVVALPPKPRWKSRVALGLVVAGVTATVLWAVLLRIVLGHFVLPLF